MREDEDTSLGLLRRELEELIGTRIDLRRRLAAWAAISEELPVGIGFMDLLRCEPFVRAVVDLLQEWGERWLHKAREIRGTPGPLQRAGVDGVEVDSLQSSAEIAGILFATCCEGKVGDAGVPSREAPIGLAVSGEIDLLTQAGLPIISGRPERSDRPALSMTAPARTR